MQKNLAEIIKDSTASIIKSMSNCQDNADDVKRLVEEELSYLLNQVFSNSALSLQLDLMHVETGGTMSYKDVIAWWQKQHITTADDLVEILENFRIVFACNSNNIEGNQMNYHTTREVFEGSNLSNFSGTAREIFEAQNQKYAFDYFIRALGDDLDIDRHMILKLHGIMMYGCYNDTRWKKGERPGKFKKGDYCVGTDNVGSFPDEVEEDIQDLLDEMNDNELDGDVLIKAAYLHVMFETIHPFADGNGRVGRTLMNYYLIRHNYPPIVIFNEDKETYYLALEVFNRTGKLNGFVKFLQEQMVKTWESRIESREDRNKITKKLSTFL